jgi:energy-coupling factor transport system permease protein
MSIALRFVPTLLDETDIIMKAQSSRGADYDTGGPISRARGLVSV